MANYSKNKKILVLVHDYGFPPCAIFKFFNLYCKPAHTLIIAFFIHNSFCFVVFLHAYLANSIKVELYSDEDPDRSTEDERGERIEEGGQDQESETVRAYREPNNPDILLAGATRMPNGKLKCDICGMICIGPNVLMVHKRSHTGDSLTQCL